MQALCWTGVGSVDVETVADPGILDPNDAILQVTSAAICGSDLHLYDGYIPSMRRGDILGHEFMGIVVETGANVRRITRGDRVVVPFNIACGLCYYCRQELYSLCENSNPSHKLLTKAYGYPGAGLFGYSHLYGGYAGGQAQYVRVPFADVGALQVPDGVQDEQVLFLGDIFPTGYMAAERCQIKTGDTVAVWGAGPVGQMAAASAYLLGAERVIVIDRVPERLALAREHLGCVALNYSEVEDVVELLKELTGGRGPDAVIDAVGMEAHGEGIAGMFDKAKQALKLQTDRPTALREAIQACRPGGTVSIPGVYGGLIDKFPIGAAFAKGLTLRMGQTHTHRYMRPLLDLITSKKVDPSFVITHRVSLADAPKAYKTFRDKAEGCIKVVLKPN